MTEEKAYQNALDDPDNPLLTASLLAKMRRVPNVQKLRLRTARRQDGKTARRQDGKTARRQDGKEEHMPTANSQEPRADSR
jgi:hypothetical protein